MIVAASGRHGQSHSHVTRPLIPKLRHRSRVSSATCGSVLEMSLNVVGHPSGDVAHGVREEPVEERDADIVGAASDAVPMRAAVASPGCTADVGGNAHPRSRPARLPTPGPGKCRETADPQTGRNPAVISRRATGRQLAAPVGARVRLLRNWPACFVPRSIPSVSFTIPRFVARRRSWGQRPAP